MPDEIDAADYRALAAKEKPRKYRNVPVEVDGIRFDSKAEAARYNVLLNRQAAGILGAIVVHPRFELKVGETHICFYIGDFQYYDHRARRSIVEDVKGVRTPAYKIKKRLMKAIYGIEITEVEA